MNLMTDGLCGAIFEERQVNLSNAAVQATKKFDRIRVGYHDSGAGWA